MMAAVTGVINLLWPKKLAVPSRTNVSSVKGLTERREVLPVPYALSEATNKSRRAGTVDFFCAIR